MALANNLSSTGSTHHDSIPLSVPRNGHQTIPRIGDERDKAEVRRIRARHGDQDRSEPDWKIVADSIPHIVWTFSADGSVEYINRWARDYSGLPADAINVCDWLALIHQDDAERACRTWGQVLRGSTSSEIEYRIRRADGAFRWHACRAVAIPAAGRDEVKWIATATDIEDQKSLEGFLLEARRDAIEATARLGNRPAVAPIEFGSMTRDFGQADGLTDRELQVLECVSEGLSNRAVAQRLGVTTNTIRNHVQRILYKLDVHSKLEAVAITAQKQVLRDFSRLLP